MRRLLVFLGVLALITAVAIQQPPPIDSATLRISLLIIAAIAFGAGILGFLVWGLVGWLRGKP